MPANPQNEGQPQNRPAISLLVLTFALIVRFVNLLLLQRAPFFSFKIGDAARYDEWANQIAAGDWIGQGVFYQAPLYPYFLGAIYSVLGNDIMTVRKVQAVIGAVSCVLLMNAVWNLFNRRAGIAAGVMIALYVPSIFLETMIQKSVLDLFFICLIVWLISRITLNASYKCWLALGAAAGGLCLTRENALALIPLFLLWCLFYRSRPPVEQLGRFKARARFAAVFVTGLAVTIGPVALRNYLVGGECHITTSQLGPNFYIGNNPSANGTYQPLRYGRGNAKYEQADAVEIAEAEMGRTLTAAEVSQFYLRKSADYIVHEPVDWLQLLGWKTLLSLNASELIDTEDQYTYQNWSPLMRALSPIANFGVLVPLAIMGIWYVRRQWHEHWILLLMIGLFQATMIMFFVFGRYRFPIVPLLICFAAPLLADLCLAARQRLTADWLRKSNNQPVKTSSQMLVGKIGELFSKAKQHWQLCLMAVTLIAICHLPIVSLRSSQAITYNNFGVQMLMRGRLDEAEGYFRQCLAIQPENALAHNNLGVVYRERQQFDQAAAHFERAISIAPDYITAWKNLGKLSKQPNQS